MDGTAAPGDGPGPERQRFLDRLAEIQLDPEVFHLARRRAGLDLALDVLSEAYVAVAEHGPDGIKDLRAYFCRVVINVTHGTARLYGRIAPSLAGDIDQDVEKHPDRCVGQSPPRPVETIVCNRLLAEAGLRKFRTQRDELTALVAGRSLDPGRYRAAIITVAEQVLENAIAANDVSDADANPALIAIYPEWFAEPGCTTNNRDQRFSRARTDVRDLLRAVIPPDDLIF